MDFEGGCIPYARACGIFIKEGLRGSMICSGVLWWVLNVSLSVCFRINIYCLSRRDDVHHQDTPMGWRKNFSRSSCIPYGHQKCFFSRTICLCCKRVGSYPIVVYSAILISSCHCFVSVFSIEILLSRSYNNLRTAAAWAMLKGAP